MQPAHPELGATLHHVAILPELQAHLVSDLLSECAGLFWIGAELAILYLLLVVRRHLEQNPAARLTFTTRERSRARLWFLAWILFALTPFGRLITVPGHCLYAFLIHHDARALPPALYIRVLHYHLGLWALFVTVWVVLEALIAFHSVCGYRQLRRIVRPVASPPSRLPLPPTFFLTLTLVTILTWRPAFADSTAAAYQHVIDADLLYRNALHLYLRVASLGWIAAEWAVALVVWRSYRLAILVLTPRKPPL